MPRTVLLGLAKLSKSRVDTDPLLEMIDEFNLGFQLYDDTRDWMQDRRERATLIVANVARALGPGHREMTDKEWAKEVYYGGHAVNTLERSLTHLNRARGIAIRHALPGWARRLSEIRS